MENTFSAFLIISRSWMLQSKRQMELFRQRMCLVSIADVVDQVHRSFQFDF